MQRAVRPLVGGAGLLAVWLVLLVLAIGWTRPRPRTVAVLPFVGFALWLGVVWVGNGRSG